MIQSAKYRPVSAIELSLTALYMHMLTYLVNDQTCGLTTMGNASPNNMFPCWQYSASCGKQWLPWLGAKQTQVCVTSTRQLRSRKQLFEVSPTVVRGGSGQHEELIVLKTCVGVVESLCAACRLVATPL